MDGPSRPVSLDVVCGARNISSVEQEFQSSPTVDRAAQLLALVLDPDAEAERGLGELAAAAELPKSTASRLLATLEQHGLVEQEGERGGFRPGPVIQRHAGRAREQRLRDAAEGPMAVLAEHTGETINLAVAGDGASTTSRRPRAGTSSARRSGSAAACPTTAPPTARC